MIDDVLGLQKKLITVFGLRISSKIIVEVGTIIIMNCFAVV